MKEYYMIPSQFQIPRQLSALTLYRCEQSALDYCHAHLSLQLNMGMEPPTQAFGGPRPAKYHPGLMPPLPSEPVLPCPQTRSLHQ
ncbi:Translation initiation factor IF-2 [Dissostichus eleginoides]|uniref:Translation initiation factor IF-2 n=1 Tax=Dissostichus eleginoides TaxID=100907 RepID=A0AAD9BYF5_DISEL|nr:Translation initiation factor IF-2 [Dissostichus eleginoides]